MPLARFDGANWRGVGTPQAPQLQTQAQTAQTDVVNPLNEGIAKKTGYTTGASLLGSQLRSTMGSNPAPANQAVTATRNGTGVTPNAWNTIRKGPPPQILPPQTDPPEKDPPGTVPPTPVTPPVVPGGPPTGAGTFPGQIVASQDGTKRYIWWNGQWQQTYGDVTGNTPPPAPAPPGQPGGGANPTGGVGGGGDLSNMLSDPNGVWGTLGREQLLNMFPWLNQDPNFGNMNDSQLRDLAANYLRQQEGQGGSGVSSWINQLNAYGTNAANDLRAMIGDPNSAYHRASLDQMMQIAPWLFDNGSNPRQWSVEEARHLFGSYLGNQLNNNSQAGNIIRWLQQIRGWGG